MVALTALAAHFARHGLHREAGSIGTCGGEFDARVLLAPRQPGAQRRALVAERFAQGSAGAVGCDDAKERLEGRIRIYQGTGTARRVRDRDRCTADLQLRAIERAVRQEPEQGRCGAAEGARDEDCVDGVSGAVQYRRFVKEFQGS